MKRLVLLALVFILPVAAHATWWEYYLIIQAGGMVQDVPKIQKLKEMYTQNVNKLNLLNGLQGDASQNLVQWQAMETTFGDGSGVIAYQPDSQGRYDADLAKRVAAYAATMPATEQGRYIANYLERQNQRDQVIAAYRARLAATAKANGKSSLTLNELSAIQNDLNGLSQENRLQQIQLAADANSLRATQREQQLRLREYMQMKRDADAASSAQ